MAYIYQTKKKDGTPHPRWRFQYRDRNGQKVKGTGYSSRRDTERLATRLEAEESAIKNGYRDASRCTDSGSRYRTMADEYLAWGDAQGGRGGRPWAERHSMSRHRHLKWWGKRLDLQLLKDLIGCLPRVELALRDLQDQGLAGKTLGQYAESLAAFCSWCVDRDYLANYPLRKLKSFDTTPLTRRRSLTPDEVARLLKAAPDDRSLLYEVAICTGLRANELRSLKVHDLDTNRSCLQLDSSWTKNRKSGAQPIPHDLTRRLSEFAIRGEAMRLYIHNYTRRNAGSLPSEPLLYIHSDPSKAFTSDLRRAEIPKATPEGKLDFHALRTTYATLVVESGANLKEAQTLLRHSSPQLTMNVYARVRKGRLGEVAESVGRLMVGK